MKSKASFMLTGDTQMPHRETSHRVLSFEYESFLTSFGLSEPKRASEIFHTSHRCGVCIQH